MNRSGIPNIKSRPYYPQPQRKNKRPHGTWKNQKET